MLIHSDDTPKIDYQFNIVICGDTSVDITTLKQNDDTETGTLKGFDYITSTTQVMDQPVTSTIYNLVPYNKLDKQDDENSGDADDQIKQFYYSAHQIIICFDITNIQSFYNIGHRWINEINKHKNSCRKRGNPYLLILGTDSGGSKQVSDKEAQV